MEFACAGMESIIGRMGRYNLRAKLRNFDKTYLRPYLIREEVRGAAPKILETFTRLTMQDVKIMVNNEFTSGNDEHVTQARQRLNSLYLSNTPRG